MTAPAPRPVWPAPSRRRLAAQLREIGCELSTVSDALEAAGRPRLSASTEAERAAAVRWLRTEEGRRAYRSAAYLRAAALAAAAEHERAEIVAAARAYGETRTRIESWSSRMLCAAIATVRAAEFRRQQESL